jgi:hypothetical protein
VVGGRILGFLYGSRCFLFQVTPQLYSYDKLLQPYRFCSLLEVQGSDIQKVVQELGARADKVGKKMADEF